MICRDEFVAFEHCGSCEVSLVEDEGALRLLIVVRATLVSKGLEPNMLCYTQYPEPGLQLCTPGGVARSDPVTEASFGANYVEDSSAARRRGSGVGVSPSVGQLHCIAGPLVLS